MTSLVTVLVCHEFSEASVARSLLEAHGVVTCCPEWHHASVAWHNMYALGGIRLMTLNTMAGEALDLLGTGASPDRTPPATRQAWVRPEVTVTDLAVALAVLIYAGLPFPLWRRRHRIA